MISVAIVDYGMSNLDSVVRAVQECGAEAQVTIAPGDLERATHVILPGVGSFADGMAHLRERGFEAALKDQVLGRRVPFLGICLGMQLLATRGFECGETPGLGWIEGDVVRLKPADPKERIPHVGWNEVRPVEAEAPLFRSIPAGKDFYFVHSWHLACSRPEQVLARTPYCGGFVSAVRRDNILGAQFHPEKSQKPGRQILKNFLEL